MTKKTKIILAITLLLFSAISYAWVGLAVRAGQAVIRVAGSQTATNLSYATLFGSAAVLMGQQTGLFELTRQNSSGEDIAVRMPLTDLPRDRPVANPQAPATDLILNPSTTQPIKDCPAAYSDPPATLAGCKYTTNYTYTKTSEFACTINFTKTPVSGCDSSNAYVLNSGTSGSVSTVSTCSQGYTLSSGTCNKNPETPSCKTGYSLQNGSCALTEPEKIPDKNCDLQSNGSGYITMPTDPDCGGVWDANEAAEIAQQNGLMSAYAAAFQMGHPENGTPQDVLMQIYPATSNGGYNGSCPYQVCIPIPNIAGHYRIAGLTSTGDGTTKYTAIDVNSNGVVDSVRSGTIAGTLAGAGTTYIDAAGNPATVQAGQAVLVNPATNGTLVQAPAVQSPALTLPSDYARAGEASNAADKITNKLSESEPMLDLATPEVTNPLIQYFNPLYAWAPNVVAGSCPGGVFTWNNNTYGFSQFCTLFEEYAPAIQSVMMVIAVIFSLFIVLGA